VVLWLAFRPTRRMPAGFVTALTGVLYAPVRFFLDYLRPEDTDPRYGTLTFAQWSSIVAFAIAIYAARRILATGQAAEIVAPTAREAQARLRIILKEDEDDQKKQEADKKAAAERKKAEIAEARVVRDREDAELAARAAQAPKASVAVDSAAAAAKDGGGGGDEGEEDDEDEDAEDAAADKAEPPPTTAGKKAAASKPGGSRSSAAKKKSKSRKR